MPADPVRNSARVLAPLALIVCAIAFFAVILSSGSDEGGGANSQPAADRTTTAPKTSASPRRTQLGSTYTVKTGDTLGSIAEKTNLSIERLQELNPELDPQALVSGQKIKLRE
jgi:LysM repeat protein